MHAPQTTFFNLMFCNAKINFWLPVIILRYPEIMRLHDDGLGDKLEFKTISLLSHKLRMKFSPLVNRFCSSSSMMSNWQTHYDKLLQ